MLKPKKFHKVKQVQNNKTVKQIILPAGALENTNRRTPKAVSAKKWNTTDSNNNDVVAIRPCHGRIGMKCMFAFNFQKSNGIKLTTKRLTSFESRVARLTKNLYLFPLPCSREISTGSVRDNKIMIPQDPYPDPNMLCGLYLYICACRRSKIRVILKWA